MESKTESILAQLDLDRKGKIEVGKIKKVFEEQGISWEDPRNKKFRSHLPETGQDDELVIDREELMVLIRDEEDSGLISRVFNRDLVIPNFREFKEDITEIYENTKGNTEGDTDFSLPEPGQNEPAFGLSICTIDGQLLQLGDHHLNFSLQSISKPISYAIAVEENGAEKVHEHVGVEPGGEDFDHGMVLNEKDLPHNPLINSGAIMCASLIKPDLENEDRLKFVMGIWEKLCGNKKPGYKKEAYDAEINASDKNFALTYLMNQRGAFPKGTDLTKTVEFHTHCCSIEMDTDHLASAAATLANYGISPFTGEKILRHKTVRNVLSLMLSSGTYDHSGEFAFRVGLPAKSGISGGIIIIVPGLMGIAVYSPPLDPHMNSVRGVDFCENLVEKFNIHQFDAKEEKLHGKEDPRKP